MMVRLANAIRPAEPALQEALLAMSTPKFSTHPAYTETTLADGPTGEARGIGKSLERSA
jgi:hypothetical protein